MSERGYRTGRLARRQLLKGAAGLGLAAAGGGLLAGCANQVAPFFSTQVDRRLETTQIRLGQVGSLCHAPQLVAQDMMRADGLTDVQYVKVASLSELESAFASGEIQIGMHFAAPIAVRIDAGDPVVTLAGVHVGCFELFGTDQVNAIRDLKGKTVAVPDVRTGPYTFLAGMLAYVGLNPREDVTWVTLPGAEAKQRLAEGTIDAYLGFAPDPQELRSKNIGHVIVNSAVDRPWSQYYCCMIAGHKEFVQQNPVATKLAMRSILKAADLCATEPDRAAQYVVDNGYTSRVDFARQALREVPYNRWREYDPEDTIRFYALRLQEIGMIKSTPDRIISQGTDWRFFNELKQELKG